MEPKHEPLDDEYIQKVLEARRMSPWDKVLAGFRLFEEECIAARERIRREHPGADEKQVSQILQGELDAERRVKEAIPESGLLP